MEKLGILISLCLVAVGATAASAELVGSEGQIASFNAKLSPSELPRHHLSPVKIRAEGEFKATAANHLAQLSSLEIAINHNGQLFTTGLPVCHMEQLVATTPKDALAACRPALIGHGLIRTKNFFPEEPSYYVKATMLAFNGRRKDGGTQLFLSVYGDHPVPFAIVIPIKVRRTKGTFGTTLFARLPGFTRRWAYLTRYQFVISRRFIAGGKERSFVGAKCPAPPGFNGGVFAFARATYRFLTTKTLRATLVATCHVRNRG